MELALRDQRADREPVLHRRETRRRRLRHRRRPRRAGCPGMDRVPRVHGRPRAGRREGADPLQPLRRDHDRARLRAHPRASGDRDPRDAVPLGEDRAALDGAGHGVRPGLPDAGVGRDVAGRRERHVGAARWEWHGAARAVRQQRVLPDRPPRRRGQTGPVDPVRRLCHQSPQGLPLRHGRVQQPPVRRTGHPRQRRHPRRERRGG